ARAPRVESRSAGSAEIRIGRMKGTPLMRQTILNTGPHASLAILAVLLLTAPSQSQQKSGHSSWAWNNSDDGRKIEVSVENKVEFTDDYSDGASIPDDGVLRIHDSRGPRTFNLMVTRGPAGDLRRTYTIDNQAHVFDAEGQAWLRRVLLEAVRQGGLDARTRVARILKSRGPRGLIEEIGYLKGDYV